MNNVNYNKYESYIRVGNTPETLADFPTPSAIGRTLHDVDVDAYTDLQGYTQRNRVRHDVEDITLTYNILSDDDLDFILSAISNEWIYVELLDKKTQTKVVHKMYASDKEFNSFKVWSTVGENNTIIWHEEQVDFSVTLVEQ